MREYVACFGKQMSLVGIVTKPSPAVADNPHPAVIFLNAGVRHRVGPKRWYVAMTRRLAEIGCTVLRFDFSGVGDSLPRDDNLSDGATLVSEVQSAMNYLSSEYGAQQFIIGGLCQGADVAFNTACSDPRVVGAILIDGYYLPEEELERITPQIYSSLLKRRTRRQLLKWNTWRRILTRKDDFDWVKRHLSLKIKSLFSPRAAFSGKPNVTTGWHITAERGVRVLLVHSEGSVTFDTLRLAHEDQLRSPEISKTHKLVIVPNVDHQFTMLWSQDYLIELVNDWVAETWGQQDPAATSA